MQELLNYKIMNNTVFSYVQFLVALIACWTAVRVTGRILQKRLNRRAERVGASRKLEAAQAFGRYLIPAAYFAAFYLCTKFLTLSRVLEKLVEDTALGGIVVTGAVFLSAAAVYVFGRYWEARRKDAGDLLASRFISGLIRVVVWAVAVILFLDNVGVKISSLLAGLGIGGVAVAFAAQAILTDVFGYFTIFFDRPFELGDYIVVGDESGTVEHIGVKTTRLRALSGEQLIFSNKDLTSSRIQNYKRMEQRRVLFTLAVTYDTPTEKLREIPELLKDIIGGIGDTSFSRCHFAAYGTYSLNFETAYYILSSDYNKYMDIHQAVNLAIKDSFQKRGIAFALPQALSVSDPEK